MGDRVNSSAPPLKSVPVGESKQTVLVTLTGLDSPGERFSLDLVAVLDVSGSMKNKMDKMKTAMQFVIQKLGPSDRLSIVSFSDTATTLCPLRNVTETSQPELLGIIARLQPAGRTNIKDGLTTALNILAGPSGGRVIGVMLMSDGEQNEGDAAQVTIDNVPVYTFGFGDKYDSKLLNTVARNSMGGTFSYVNEKDGLTQTFSQILAILLTVVVQNLKLTVRPVDTESTIEKVTAGSYPQTPGKTPGSVTVSLGNLSTKEVRIVTVDLLLLASDMTGYNATILKYEISYTVGGIPDGNNTKFVFAKRTGPVPGQPEDDQPEDDQPPQEVQEEKARVEAMRLVKAARTTADDKNMEDARYKVGQAQNVLFNNVVDQKTPLMLMLYDELAQLMKLMENQDVYEKQGRSYALSSETSHDLQRFAVRGDIDSARLFATPRMDKYLEQAKRFDEDPKAPLLSVDEDVKEELAANPLLPFSGPITIYIQNAIEALQAIERLINKGGKP